MNYGKFYYDQIRARVNRINEQFQEKESISFLRLTTSLILGLDASEVDEYITDGGNDLGADAIYFDINHEEKRFKLYVVQAKYNKASCVRGIFNQNIGEEVINKFKNIFDYFATETSGGSEVNDRVKGKKEEYLNMLEDGYILDELFFISSNLGIGPAKNVKAIFDRWLTFNPYRDKIKYLHFGLQDVFNKIQDVETPNISENIHLYGRYFEYSTPDVKGLIGTISANELIRIYELFGDKLFQQNVRYYLGENVINKKIIKSASEASTKDKFWFLNNGITIVCEHYEKTGTQTENIVVNLTNFNIVNGTQTTRSTYEAFKNTGNIDEVKVLLKIFKARADLSEQITESTNSQNPVNTRDLRSNDEIQKLLEKSLKDREFYYQRKRNQWLNVSRDKIIDNFTFAQLFSSFYLKKPHEARNQKSKLFGDDAVYSVIFNDSLLPEKVIFLHKLYQKVLANLRIIKRQETLLFPSDIIDRSKFFLLCALRLNFEKNGKAIEDIVFLTDESNINEINETVVLKFIGIIGEQAIRLIDEKQLNNVKVFQRKELVEYIEAKIFERPSER